MVALLIARCTKVQCAERQDEVSHDHRSVLTRSSTHLYDGVAFLLRRKRMRECAHTTHRTLCLHFRFTLVHFFPRTNSSWVGAEVRRGAGSKISWYVSLWYRIYLPELLNVVCRDYTL